MKKWKEIHKEYQKLSLLSVNLTGKECITHQEKMIGKSLRKNNLAIALNMLYVKKMNIYVSK